MKFLFSFILFSFFFLEGKSQLPDSIPFFRDTVTPKPSVKLNVFSDTTQVNDTVILKTVKGLDTVVKKKVFSPKKATLRSLIIPGWGQVYNKKYWKVPIVYAAVGVPVYLFFDNRQWYQRTRYALAVVVNNTTDVDSLSRIHPDLQGLVDRKAQGSLVNYRNSFRKNMDYSILFTLLMWSLNVVDATVDAHLKGFDVSDELSLRIKPAMMQGSLRPGLSVVVNFK